MATAPTAKEAPAPAQAAPAGGGGKKKILMLALILVVGVVLGGAGIGAWAFMKSKDADKDKKGPDDKHVLVLMKEPIIINIKAFSGVRYFRIKVGLEASKSAVADLEKWAPYITDFLIEHMGNMTIAQVDNTEGRNELKNAIKNKINEMLTKDPPDMDGGGGAAAEGEGAAKPKTEEGKDKEKVVYQVIFTDFIIS